MIFNVWALLQWYLRPLIKWFLRKTTQLCELQRICYGEKSGSSRTLGIEKSLNLSRTKEIKEVITFLDTVAFERKFYSFNFPTVVDPAIAIIVRIKNINPRLHRTFTHSFKICLIQIWSYKQLMVEVEELRKTQFDSGNINHENKLLKLWSILMQDEVLESRVTKQWQTIGFQGEDPKTDFRGMGMLGLENLLFFAEKYPQIARHVLSHSHHPKYGYTFAIVGINLTSMAYYLLKDGSAKCYMFNAQYYLPNMNLFHMFYCYLFYEFDKMWIDSKPQNIMEFSVIFKKFENCMRSQLADSASVFRINLETDTI